MNGAWIAILLLNIGALSLSLPQISSRIILDSDDPTHHRDFDSCEIPTILWKGDGECYPVGERGPCGPGELLILSRQSYAAECTKSVKKLSKTSESEALKVENTETKEEPSESEALIVDNAEITEHSSESQALIVENTETKKDTSESEAVIVENTETREEPSDDVCNRKEEIYWPENNSCYSLLEQGPCNNGEWLVLNSTDPLRARCTAQPCDDPASQAYWAPLCQCVDTHENIRSGRYTPEEVCGQHTQLVWSPYGHGVCSCDSGFYMDDRGRCYALGSQGPCEVGEVWELDDGVLKCVDSKIELKIRVFDLVAHDQRAKVVIKCYQDSMGKCRKTLGLDVSRFGFGSFSDWANSFTPVTQECSACSGDKILWTDEQCYQAASTGPCEKDEWLVLEGIFDGRPVVRCTERQCPDNQIFWEPSCRCVQTDRQGRQPDSSPPCGGENYRLLVDPFGKGVCSCAAGFKLDSGVCTPDTDVDLTKFVNVRSNLESNIANQINCNAVQAGFCKKDYISENHEVTKAGLEDLISWLESFPKPTELCTGSLDKLTLQQLEEKCAQESKIVYEGKCAELLTSEPCANDTQWLILEKVRNRLIPICEVRPCPDHKVFFEKDCECHLPEESVCTPNEEVFINIFGHGTCGCKADSAFYPPDGKCYPVGERGPCADDEVLLLQDVDVGRCVQCTEQFLKDEADEETDIRGDRERFFFGSLVELEEDVQVNQRRKRQIAFKPLKKVTSQRNLNSASKQSRCFNIGQQGKCPDDQQVGLSADSAALECISGAQTTPAPQDEIEDPLVTPENCALDTRGRCRRSRLRGSSAEEFAALYSSWVDSFLPWAPELNICLHTVILPF